MYKQSTNIRVHKSQVAIAEAYLRVLKTTRHENMTISSICKEAGLTRKTFYRDFESIDDVVDFLVSSESETVFASTSLTDFEKFCLSLFTFCAKEKAVLQLFQERNIYYLLVHFFNIHFHESPYISSLADKAGITAREKDYLISAFVGSQTYTIWDWVKGGCVETPEEMAALSAKIVKAFSSSIAQ